MSVGFVDKLIRTSTAIKALPAQVEFDEPIHVAPTLSEFVVKEGDSSTDVNRTIVEWCKSSWGWLASVAIHALVVLVLGLITIHPMLDDGTTFLTVDPARSDDEAEVSRVTSFATPALSSSGGASSQLAVAARIPAADTIIGSLAIDLIPQLGGQSNTGTSSGPAGDVFGLLGPKGDGMTETGLEKGQAQFFGVQATGNKFVFVVDSSRSMSGKKWTRTCRELLRSLDRLGQDQTFCVYFFDAEVHLMFNQKPHELKLIRPTKDNLKRFRRWLTSIDMGNNTLPLTAVRFALKMKPDAVFLLSDGEFQDSTDTYLRAANLIHEDDGTVRHKIVVHTICFKSLAGAGMLKLIADENGGSFRFVK